MRPRSFARLSRLALGLLIVSCGGTNAGPSGSKNVRILSFDGRPSVIEAGQEVTLDWETSGATGVNIEPRIGLQSASGTATDRPLATTTYTLTVPGGPKDLTAQVTIEVSGGPPVVTDFRATPRTISDGETATLSWSTTNADQVTIEPGIGPKEANGSVTVSPRVTTTYRLTATRGVQAAPPQEVVVVVASGNQPVVRTFTASPQTVAPGQAVTLTWETTNATNVTIDNGIGPQATSGSYLVTPQQTTIYSLTASGAGGSSVASVTVTVVPAGDPSILLFEASPETIAPGGMSELSWDTDNAASVTIDNGVGARAPKGSLVVGPAQTTTYTLTAAGIGTQVTRAVTVTVAAQGTPVVLTFSAQPGAVLQGGSTTLTWTTQNAMTVDLDNGAGTGLPANGSVQVSPAQTTVYTLTARGASGSATSMTTVVVNPAPPSVTAFSAQPASVIAGGSTTLTWSTQNATDVSIDNGLGTHPANGSVQVTPGQTTLYTLTANGPGGSATAQVGVTVATPGAPVIATFSGAPLQVGPGGVATLSWDVRDATAVSIDNGVGAQSTVGSVQVTPAQTTTYTLTADGPGGTTSAQVTISVVSTVGDRCSDAFVIAASGSFTGDTQQAIDDYSETSACTGYTSTGPDVVYVVSLQAGDRLTASLAPSGASWDAVLYLLSSCASVAQSCVAGQDNGNPEELDYTAAMAGDYYLVADGFGGAGGSYTLDVTITPAPLPNDTCAGAMDVTAGGSYSGDTTHAAGDYSPGSGGCTTYAEASGDLAYRVTLAAGERLQATLSATWDAALYLVSDCANVAGTCLAGQDNGNPEELDYTAASAGSYFLIADGWGSARGAFTLDVSISPPVSGGDTCQTAVEVPAGGGSFQSTTTGLANDYSPPSTCTGYTAEGADQAYRLTLEAGDVVEVLAEFDPGLDGSAYVVQSCASLASCLTGADEGNAGEAEALRFVAVNAGPHYVILDSYGVGTAGAHDLSVLAYTGETCAEAAPLELSGIAEPYSTAGRANDYSPNSGGCTGFSAAGADRAYSVAVSAGDQLQVTVTPTGHDASIYVVSSCADVSGSCVAGSDRVVSGAEELSPIFQQAGTHHLIIDGYGSASGAGTVSARIARGDTCDDAYRVPAGGAVFQGTTAGYGADLGASASAGSCTGYTQDGKDAVFEVTLGAGETLTASLSTTWDGSLYLVSDCAAASTTCLTGQDNGNPEELTYTNTGAQAATYWLVVDSWRDSTETLSREGNYTLTIGLP